MCRHRWCHLHAQALSSHGGRLLLFHGWVSGESDPSACLWYSGCTRGFSAQGHLGLLLLGRRLSCMTLFVFACTSHAVSPRPGLVKLLALSNFPAFVHCDPRFTGLYGQCCLLFCDTLCHRCFLLPDRMRVLSPVSRTQWLLCADPPFFCAPLMTRLRNGSLVSDALFLGGLICFRICLFNSFHCFGVGYLARNFFPIFWGIFFQFPGFQTGSKQASKQASKQGRKEGRKEGSKQAGKQASKPASQPASQPASKQASKQGSRQASKQGSRQASKPASQPASKQASKQGSKGASKQGSKQAGPKQPREQASKQGEQAMEQARGQASKQAREQAREQASKGVSTQASKRASKGASKQAGSKGASNEIT